MKTIAALVPHAILDKFNPMFADPSNAAVASRAIDRAISGIDVKAAGIGDLKLIIRWYRDCKLRYHGVGGAARSPQPMSSHGAQLMRAINNLVSRDVTDVRFSCKLRGTAPVTSCHRPHKPNIPLWNLNGCEALFITSNTHVIM